MSVCAPSGHLPESVSDLKRTFPPSLVRPMGSCVLYAIPYMILKDFLGFARVATKRVTQQLLVLRIGASSLN